MSQTPTDSAWAGMLKDPFLGRVIKAHEEAHGPVRVLPPDGAEIVLREGARRVAGLEGDCGAGPLNVLKRCAVILELLLELSDLNGVIGGVSGAHGDLHGVSEKSKTKPS